MKEIIITLTEDEASLLMCLLDSANDGGFMSDRKYEFTEKIRKQINYDEEKEN